MILDFIQHSRMGGGLRTGWGGKIEGCGYFNSVKPFCEEYGFAPIISIDKGFSE